MASSDSSLTPTPLLLFRSLLSQSPRPNDPPRLLPHDQAPLRPTFPAASEATRRSCKPDPTPGVRQGSAAPSGWKRGTQAGTGQRSEAHDHYLSSRRASRRGAAEVAETPNTATSGARCLPTEGSGSWLGMRSALTLLEPGCTSQAGAVRSQGRSLGSLSGSFAAARWLTECLRALCSTPHSGVGPRKPSLF